MGLKELLEEIRKQMNQTCISRSCRGNGCRVYLTGVPSDRIIVNLECEFEQRKISTKRCDYVIFYADHIQFCFTVRVSISPNAINWNVRRYAFFAKLRESKKINVTKQGILLRF